MTNVHVDRIVELDDIARRAAEALAGSVGVVCGIRQIGKSQLLYQARAQDNGTRPACMVDLADVTEPEEVLQRLVRRLQTIRFRNYTKVKSAIEPVRPTLTFGEVTMSGQASMHNVIDGVDQRASDTRRLTPPFVEDLRKARGQRPLLLFDHFDRCPSAAVGRWLCQDLLPDIARTADVLVLVAAESVPWAGRDPQAWIDGVDPFVLHLQPLSVDDVLDWITQLGIEPSRVLADFLWKTRKGVPGPIADELGIYLAESGTGRP
ncbi:hypothetical protein [Dactylosporangium sp. NPDC051541]|uniref:hypothetical protein n=1 Tax=Dactylosporangium sp. NPDC051541 TaxID=3363977 RepID=UPI0037967794